MAGVIAVITHENSPQLPEPLTLDGGSGRGAAATALTVLQKPDVYWNDQPIVLVVADTQETAEYAANLIHAEYAPAEAHTHFAEGKQHAKTPAKILTEETEVVVGDAAAELQKAPHQLDNLYHTPGHNHNALEPHATIATFCEDGRLLVFDATQHSQGVKATLAQLFNVNPDNVQAIYPFVGGGFGSKGTMWMNTMLCVLAARQVGRPVKLALSRAGVFRLVGGRAATEQRVAIGADADGHFRAIIHSGVSATTEQAPFPEPFSFPVRHLYAADSFYIGQQIFNLDIVTNSFMRAPGESVGTFALESAVDELAHQLGLDPIALRARNEPTADPAKGTDFSMRNLPEAYRRGAEKFN